MTTTTGSTGPADGKRSGRALAASFAGLVIVAIVILIAVRATWTGFLYAVGVHYYGATSQWYNFWSGFGSDLGEVSILTGLVLIFRHHNCQVHRCWRLGTHPVDGTPYHACHVHHPSVPSRREQITADLIASEWRAAHPAPPQ